MAENKEPARGGWGSSALVVVLACLAAGMYISYQRQDYVAAGAAAVVAAGVCLGYWKGAVGFLALAAAAAGGYSFAATVDRFAGPLLDVPLDAVGFNSPAVRLAACGVITAAAIQTLVLIVGSRFIAANPSLKSLNGMIGMSLGGAQSAGAVLLFLCGILAITPQRSSIVPGLVEPTTTGRIERLAFETRKSALFPYLTQYDPFVRFPELKKQLDSARPRPQYAVPSSTMRPPAAAQVPVLLRREPFRGW